MFRICPLRIKLVLFLLQIVATPTLTLHAQQPQPAGKSKSPSSNSPIAPQVKTFEQHAAYWSSEPGWGTELRLKNNLAAGSLIVTPVLRLASGQEISLDPVTIPSNSSVSAWVNEGLLKHSPGLLNQPGSYGSVAFRFTSFSPMNLHATAVSTINGEPLAFPSGAHPAWLAGAPLAGDKPGSLQGIWWQPRPELKDVLVISNSAEKKISGTLSVFDADGKQWSEALSLGPHQTWRTATSDLVREAGLSGSYGGIEFDVPALAAALNSVHFMYDEAGKFSASLDVFKRDPNATMRERAGSNQKQWTIWAPMLALRAPDPTLGLPHGTVLQPIIFVRNTTGEKVSANATLSWRGDSGNGHVKLPQLEFAPFATQQLQIGALQKQVGIPDDAHWALVSVTTTGSPDDLIAIASSRDASGRYNVATNFSGGLGGSFAGGEWRADATHDEIVAVTNGGSHATDALLTLHYDNGKKKYELQQKIQPGEQMWLNLAGLVRNRLPDRQGRALPVELSSVTYDVQDLTPGGHALMVSNLAVDNTLGNQVVPECPSCCGYNIPSITFAPDPVNIVIDGTENLAVNAFNACSGILTDISLDFTYWASNNSSIAAVTKGKVQGVRPGFTTGIAQGSVPSSGQCACTYPIQEPSVPITVTPTISQNQNFWYFGSGIPTPSGFTLWDNCHVDRKRRRGGELCVEYNYWRIQGRPAGHDLGTERYFRPDSKYRL
jgi:hypothetical protein